MNGNLFPDLAADAPGERFTAHCDGGSRGNPGPSGYGAVIEDANGRVVAELSEYLGVRTNNYAEYSGLLAVLHWAIENGTKRLRVVSDSELMVKQMQGSYKVKSPCLGRSPASRCAIPCAAETSKPTAWPTRPWTKAWDGNSRARGMSEYGRSRSGAVSGLKSGEFQVIGFWKM
jgi:ribonuclease HI